MMMINNNVESLTFSSSSFGGNTDIDACNKELKLLASYQDNAHFLQPGLTPDCVLFTPKLR